MEAFVTEFTNEAIRRMEENTVKISKCLAELQEEQVWRRPNKYSNSTGNLILHLCGNITQYIIATLGNVADERERDKEFSAEGGLSKQALMEKLETTIGQAIRIIRTIDPSDVLRKRAVQVYELSAIGIILHVVEHYSYHTGQIAYWTKILKDKDLGFYANLNLNKKNRI